MRYTTNNLPPVGTRVRLTRSVDVFPVGIFDAGQTGTVASHDHERTMVRLDVYHPELAEWNNELELFHWPDESTLPVQRIASLTVPVPAWWPT